MVVFPAVHDLLSNRARIPQVLPILIITALVAGCVLDKEYGVSISNGTSNRITLEKLTVDGKTVASEPAYVPSRGTRYDPADFVRYRFSARKPKAIELTLTTNTIDSARLILRCDIEDPGASGGTFFWVWIKKDNQIDCRVDPDAVPTSK